MYPELRSTGSSESKEKINTSFCIQSRLAASFLYHAFNFRVLKTPQDDLAEVPATDCQVSISLAGKECQDSEQILFEMSFNF